MTEVAKVPGVEELAKKFAGLGAHFKKAAEAHTAMSMEHAEHAAFHKGKHESMDDGHELKAYMGKAAGHHEKMAGFHKAHAAHLAEMADDAEKAAKAAGAVVPARTLEKCAHQKAMTEACADCKRGATSPEERIAGDAVQEMLDRTIKAMLAKAFETIATSGQVEDAVNKMVVAQVEARLSGKTVPDDVRGALSGVPGLQLVPRTGAAPIEKAVEVEPELAETIGSTA